jgi:hypothetical protein
VEFATNNKKVYNFATHLETNFLASYVNSQIIYCMEILSVGLKVFSFQPIIETQVSQERQTHVSPSLDSIIYATHAAKSTSMLPTYVAYYLYHPASMAFFNGAQVSSGCCFADKKL